VMTMPECLGPPKMNSRLMSRAHQTLFSAIPQPFLSTFVKPSSSSVAKETPHSLLILIRLDRKTGA
jgi:hypothetical protein